jgi:hypothetical protein
MHITSAILRVLITLAAVALGLVACWYLFVFIVAGVN